MPKTIKEHLTWAELIKTLIILGAGLGATSVTSNEPQIETRVAVLESRIDPINSNLQEISKQLNRIQKTQDSTNVIMMMHMQKDKE